MRYTARDIRINIKALEGKSEIDCIADSLKLPKRTISDIVIERRSLDSRFHESKGIFYVYTLSFDSEGEIKRKGISPSPENARLPKRTSPEIIPPVKYPREQPVIVGSGPAGLFCALRLVQYGFNPLILEAGEDIGQRGDDVDKLMNEGILNTSSNVQFGLGGAGTFSDGKLRTRIKSPLKDYVLERFVEFGAQREILIEAKPHIGTDKLRGIISSIKEYLESRGAVFRFSSPLTNILLEGGRVARAVVKESEVINCRDIFLCIGNAARKTFAMVEKAGVLTEAKPISVGVRVEHGKEIIDRYNYGKYAGNRFLPTSDMTLTYKDISGRGVYTFCSCPGGYVINSSTENGGLCVNGMSYSDRGNSITNSAFVVNVTPKDYPGDSPLGGIRFQQAIERKTFAAGGGDYRAPIMTMSDFLGVKGEGSIEPTIRPGYRYTDINEVIPEIIAKPLKNAFSEFNRRIEGFSSGLLTACETRTSSPVRILRDSETCESVNTKGLYPAGEGAGYAGGIMSSAVDGVRCADMMVKKYEGS